ncbi:MAG TPA: phospholipase D-like domain-containing protein [Rubrobacter sp.]|jgi:cardiolipin synthase|nr:phospholipase D-like domain-containing protein [Rubrobacter sp.]
MSQEGEVRHEDLPIPEYVASRGARLEGILGRVSDAPLREGNRLELLRNGPDTYDDWLRAISRAERWIHLDNYIFANDEIGNTFAEALSARAAEGVRVRVLHDWFGCMDVPRSFWNGMRRSGVQVKAVNPPASGPPLGAIRRDHRKLIVVDGEYASTGGVCIADGWMVRSKETGLPYRDTAVSVGGPVVADVNRAFTKLWGELVEELPDDEHPDPEGIPAAGETPARLVVQEPRRMRTLRMLEFLTAGVQERLWVTDPYFLSLPILTQSLMATARDGVDVRVLTPATNDIAWIGRASRAGYRQFLEAGVRIFEYGGPMIHAKTIVADGWWSKVGSTNLNFSSLVANWEVDLVVEDTDFAKGMEQLFEDDVSNSREVRLEGSGQHRRVRPAGQVDTRDSGARAGVVGSGTGSGATISRVVPTVVQKGAAPLQTHEHAIAAAASGVLLGASLLGARFPRLVAWPLTAVGAFLGGLGVLRVVRSRLSDREPDRSGAT